MPLRRSPGSYCQVRLASFTPFPARTSILLSTANITMQFGAKPLFENVSVKFGEGNRYA